MRFTLLIHAHGKTDTEHFKTMAAAKKRIVSLNAWADVADVDDAQLDHIQLFDADDLIYTQGVS